MLTWPIDHSAVPATSDATEGGVKRGSRVIIRLPGDDWDGQTHTVMQAKYPRVCLVGADEKYRPYCVAALEHASV